MPDATVRQAYWLIVAIPPYLEINLQRLSGSFMRINGFIHLIYKIDSTKILNITIDNYK